MGRIVSRTIAALFIVVGITGFAFGIYRIAALGQVMPGLADVIIGGFVAVQGASNWREAY